MDIQQIKDLMADDMKAVDELVCRRLSSDVALINQLGQYIVHSGGKRLRPLVALVSARAFDYDGPWHIQLAAIIEFIHTATLLHDDVVDASQLRRGQETANALFGNEASVLVGDYLYSRAFEMMVDINNMRVMDILASTTNTIAEGEVMQLMNVHDPDVSEERYIEVIHCKTAKLFEAATRLGAVLAGGSPEQEKALAHYGMHLGTAFQLIDDELDYSADATELGKNIGDDLAEGKPTLPLIYALRTGTDDQIDLIRDAVQQGGRKHIAAVSAAIESTGAIAYTARRAREEAEAAIASLEILEDSPFRQALIGLAEFSVDRNF